MKLVITIIKDDDSSDLLDALSKEGYGVTKLASTGGFLKAGNTTLIIGIEDTKVDAVIGIVSKICKTRVEIINTPSPMSGSTGVYVPCPIEIEVGGATIFVLDVDKFIKI